jgi:type VI secretion system secreted protein Hcp
MATNLFLQLSAPTGVLLQSGFSKAPVGESLDTSHQSWIELKSVQFGVDNANSIGGGTGRAKFQEFQITKSVDVASPALFAVSASGARFPTVSLAVRKTGAPGSVADNLKYEFHVVYITSIQWSGDANSNLTETITFAYAALGVDYRMMDQAGKLLPPSIATWDQLANSAPDSLTFNSLT